MGDITGAIIAGAFFCGPGDRRCHRGCGLLVRISDRCALDRWRRLRWRPGQLRSSFARRVADMGRRKGNPIDQAAMGHPGKRKSKTERAIAEAERQAKLLALPRADETSDSPPAYLADPRAGGRRWRSGPNMRPRLDKLHLLARLDRHTFALFCVYAGEFVVANEDVLVKGYSSRVKTVSGDYMLRENPSVSRRDFAAKMVLELSSKFRPDPGRPQQAVAATAQCALTTRPCLAACCRRFNRK